MKDSNNAYFDIISRQLELPLLNPIIAIISDHPIVGSLRIASGHRQTKANRITELIDFLRIKESDSDENLSVFSPFPTSCVWVVFSAFMSHPHK